MITVTEGNLSPSPGARQFLYRVGVFFMMMSYPLLSMIWRHQYPMISAEVLLFFASMILLALPMAVLTTVCRSWLANIIFAVSITLVLILQFNLLLEESALLLAITVLLALALGSQFQGMAFAVFVALIIGALIDSKLDRARNYSQLVESGQQAPLAPVVHILLDGFIGPDGLPPQSVPQAFRSEMRGFFRENGFELYSQAYSHYHSTENSLNHAFNFTNGSENLFAKSRIFHTNLSVTENRYFELLHQSGYKINIYQSESVDFCQAVPGAVGRCMTYTIPNLDTVRENVSSPWLRFRILAINLFGQSTLIHMFLQKNMWLLGWGVTLYQPNVIDEIGDDLEQAGGGVFFAHLLLPHGPFVYGQDCQLDYSSETWERAMAPGLDRNTINSRAVRYLRYLPQAKCALNEVERLFRRMRKLGLYDDAIIVVHGDHGSTISLHSASYLNQDSLTPEDYRDNFSTLFAIKLPGGEFRELTETVSLNVLLSRAAMEITGQQLQESDYGVIAEEVPFIYLPGQFPLLRQDVDIFAQP